MTPHEKPKTLHKPRWIAALSIALLAAAVLTASRRSTEFSDWLCFNVYPVFSGIGSRLWGIFPFSAGELFVISVILGAIVGIAALTIKTVKNKGQRIKTFLNGFSWAALTASIIFLLLTLNCLVNYNRTPFSSYSGLTVRQYKPEELRELIVCLIDKTNEAAAEAELTAEGHAVKPENFNALAVSAMESLTEDYKVLDTYYPQPKAVMCSNILSSFNISGMYFPITVEANYNAAMPVSSQGFTACHELSHLSGFIREDEANFIAYLACRDSEDPYFRYSGYLEALTYALNAYYPSAEQEDYNSLCGMLSETVLNEYAYRSEYWAQFRKKTTYKVSSAINDAYLKSNNQTDGVKSYGRVVDLMLAEYNTICKS